MFIFFISLFIIVGLIQWYSIKNALKGISYDYKFSRKLIEIDEETEMISTVTNETRRFVPFIRMVESLPTGIKVLNKSVFIKKDTLGMGFLSYNSSIYLTSRSRLQRKLKIAFIARGRYVFPGAELRGGDFLGFKETREKYEVEKEVVVFPKAIKNQKIDQLVGGFLGDLSVRRFIMEDPILTIGTRDYTGREPFKQISWKHVARSNQLMVKQFDYTTEMVVTIFLDTSAVGGKTINPSDFEHCFSLTRTVCQTFERKLVPFEFITNTKIDSFVNNNDLLQQGIGKQHLRLILEKLGRAAYGTTKTYEAIINELTLNKEPNQTYVIITPRKDYSKEKLAKELTYEQGSSELFIYGEDYTDMG